MVSRPTPSAMPVLMTCSVTSLTVQRDRPSGGGPHTIATIAASCVLSSFLSGLPRGSSISAASRPRAT